MQWEKEKYCQGKEVVKYINSLENVVFEIFQHTNCKIINNARTSKDNK